MGRLAAYLGPATKIAQVIEAGSTSLSLQSAAFPDGFGVAWYPEDDEDDDSPVLVRHLQPLATQGHLLEPMRRYPSACVMAAIGRRMNQPAEIASCQPFRFENLLFAHDGELDRFDEVYARPLHERLSNRTYGLVKSHDPSELLFATWLDALGVQRGPEALATALEQMVSTIQDLAQRYDAPASFGCVVTDGTCLITLRTATHGAPPPLYTIVAGDSSPLPNAARVVASEPLFNGSWAALDPHSLVIFTVEPA
jgi:predicted glutamine amidotransferase